MKKRNAPDGYEIIESIEGTDPETLIIRNLDEQLRQKRKLERDAFMNHIAQVKVIPLNLDQCEQNELAPSSKDKNMTQIEDCMQKVSLAKKAEANRYTLPKP